jgi:hypothetical protein
MSLSKAAPESTNNRMSRTEEVLLEVRKDLWKVPFPRFLDPFREFVLDPSIQFWTIVLPPMVTHYYTGADGIVATYITYTTLGPIRIALRISHIFANTLDLKNGDDTIRGPSSRRNLLHSSSKHCRHAGQLQPPSEYASSLRGFFAFLFSASADWIGAMLHPRKMRKWVETMADFHAYLRASRVGDALEEAMIKPLYRGRLLDNIKMLHDIQELYDAERVERVRIESMRTAAAAAAALVSDTGNAAPTDALALELASAMMRYATAAYGTEMILSAIDVEANLSDLETEREAIAFHTGISQADVKLLKLQEGENLTFDDCATPTLSLPHFIAVDHRHKAVVLAIRGTLSISGALVDIQAMDSPYCTGRAHKGMAEMADAVWNESGAFLTTLLNEEGHQDYDLIITGHSLGAGTACLLHIKVHVEGLVLSDTNRRVLCFGFAPPPTFSWDIANSNCEAIERAIKHSVCYIHDSDCVPHLSVATIRRLATILDAVDNYNEKVWFWNRALVFWGWKPVPKELIDIVANAQKAMESNSDRSVDCRMIIPAKVVVWCKKINNKFEAIPCCPRAFSDMNIFVCEDMVAHHLPEQYEDSLDAMLQTSASSHAFTGIAKDIV